MNIFLADYQNLTQEITLKDVINVFLYHIIFPTKIYRTPTSCIRYSEKLLKNGLWAWKKSDYSIVQCTFHYHRTAGEMAVGDQSAKTKQKAKERSQEKEWHTRALPACLLRLWLTLGVDEPFPRGRKRAAPLTVRKLSLMLQGKITNE